MKMQNSKIRKTRASALVEAPGALMLLFFFIVFPLLDLLFLGAKYASCYSLHQILLREAALIPASRAQDPRGPVKFMIPQQWSSSGMGAFVDLNGLPFTAVSYKEGERAANMVEDQYVLIENRFSLKPILTVTFPGFPELPGLNAPLVFTMQGQRLLENPAEISR